MPSAPSSFSYELRKLLATLKATRVASVLLYIAASLLVLSVLPTSTTGYLVCAEYRPDSHANPATTWFGNLGYCVSLPKDDITETAMLSPPTTSEIRCSPKSFGLDTSALETEGTLPSGFFTSSEKTRYLVESLLTKQPAVLTLIAVALCGLGLFCFEMIPYYPKEAIYVVAVGATLLGLLMSGLAGMFALSFTTLLGDRSHLATASSETGELKTTLGPIAYAIVAALACQAVACTIGFYVTIGAKYDCEGGIRLGDDGEEEKRGTGMEKWIALKQDDEQTLNEKCSV
ncbi:hypothetical protein F5Y16DRAFT_226359 [Xylariaceae sp. FL0255]|nr:hypothetical protein F5Y16DRAFT_226359 [Xylariaceae sp. FL0255]